MDASSFDANGDGKISQQEFIDNAAAFGYVGVNSSLPADTQMNIFLGFVQQYDTSGNGEVELNEANVALQQVSGTTAGEPAGIVEGDMPAETSTTEEPVVESAGAEDCPETPETCEDDLPQAGEFDTNGNGNIDEDEFDANAAVFGYEAGQFDQFLEDWDHNDDGDVGLSDANNAIEAAACAPEQEPEPTVPLPAFESVDTSGDGQITGTEYAASGLAATTGLQFNQIDTNGNGLIDQGEWLQASLPEYSEVNTDPSNEITGTEFAAANIQTLYGITFAQADTNGNGLIDQAEWDTIG